MVLFSFLSSTLGRVMMLVAIGAFLSGGAYLKGVSDAREDFTLQTLKADADTHDKLVSTHIQTQGVSTVLQTKATELTDLREEKYEQTTLEMDSLLEKYGRTQPMLPSVSLPAVPTPTLTQGHRECPGISVAPSPIVVKVSDEWGFSAKDRQALIREAARADKAVVELNACKAFVKEIYDSHGEYKKVVEDYLYHK